MGKAVTCWLAAAGALWTAVGAGCGARRPGAPPPHSGAGIQFENVAERAGIRYRWPQQPRPIRILETMGRGCAFLDLDNDGLQDVLLASAPTILLYRNTGGGHFEDVTDAFGLKAIKGDWKGCAVGDYDGDGYLDILLTGYHCLALLKNDQGRRFIDVTRSAGLDPGNRGHFGLSAGFMDLDGSGRPAIVLANYVDFGPKDEQYCMVKGFRSGCPVDHYRAEFPELWQNLGNGRFKDVTAAAGLKSAHGRAMVVAFADVDGDGRADIYIGNDGMPAELMRNLGGLRFSNIGVSSGAAFGPLGHPIAAMGADWGDYDRDGRPDLAVTAFSDEPFSLLRNMGRNLFLNVAEPTGIAGQTFAALGFGTKWLDMDNDGWPDLACANGHVYDNSGDMDPVTPFREPMMLFHNEAAGVGRQFKDLVRQLGGDLARPILGRGLATGDFDNDGRIDLLVVDYEGGPWLLHNTSRTANHWITFDLRGLGANRFALGAQVTARAGSNIWTGMVSPASSYLSSSDPRVHFGLGGTSKLDSVSVQWSDGKRTVLKGGGVDRFVTIIEGSRATSLP